MLNVILLDIDSSSQTNGSKWLDNSCDSIQPKLEKDLDASDSKCLRLWLDKNDSGTSLTILKYHCVLIGQCTFILLSLFVIRNFRGTWPEWVWEPLLWIVSGITSTFHLIMHRKHGIIEIITFFVKTTKANTGQVILQHKFIFNIWTLWRLG